MGWKYPSIPKLQRLHRWSLGMDKQFHPMLYHECNYLSILGLKWNLVSKGAPSVGETWRYLTHWDRVTHICVSRQTITGSDNGLSPGRRQAIIWTNAGKLLFGPPGTNFSEILIEILTFSFKKMQLKMSSAKRRPFCLGLNVSMITTEAQPHPGNYFHGTLFPEFAYTVKPVCNDHLYNKIY